MRNLISRVLCLLFCLFSIISLQAQIAITGPTCVVAGTTYQYSITGNWTDQSTMQICITGGIVADSSNGNISCTPTGAPIARVLVIWNDSALNSGTLSLTSPSGNATLQVHFTDPLLAGSIDSLSKTQFVALDSIPGIIRCAADSGGACTPSYLHQWQQSLDNVSWTDVFGAISDSLTIDSALPQTTFFRRRVIESISGSISYSDAATVFVGVDMSQIRNLFIENYYVTLNAKQIRYEGNSKLTIIKTRG